MTWSAHKLGKFREMKMVSLSLRLGEPSSSSLSSHGVDYYYPHNSYLKPYELMSFVTKVILQNIP